jgi:hypothetical protein
VLPVAAPAAVPPIALERAVENVVDAPVVAGVVAAGETEAALEVGAGGVKAVWRFEISEWSCETRVITSV